MTFDFNTLYGVPASEAKKLLEPHGLKLLIKNVEVSEKATANERAKVFGQTAESAIKELMKDPTLVGVRLDELGCVATVWGRYDPESNMIE